MGQVSVALETLGCKLNQAESESLGRRLGQAGFQLVPLSEDPDVYVLNTCTVTRIADRKARQRVRQVRRGNPRVFISAVGCYAQRSPQDLLESGADLVLGNDEKERLPELLLSKVGSGGAHPIFGDRHVGRTRTLVKIQYGCGSGCSFCIVPQVRPEEYSVPAEQVIGEIKERVLEGYKEVVLTGTKIGSYWWGGVGGLPSLIEKILAETKVERLRLSSLRPQEMTPDLFRLWESERLCNHLHMSLQSGSDAVLSRMQRGYSAADFRCVVALAREMIPGVAITTDVIVGFPGESREEFEESFRFCEDVCFARTHVFPYSPRPGTSAEGMGREVDDSIKGGRALRMGALGRESALRFAQRFVGQTMPVLWEQETETGVWSGLTGNYLRVFASTNMAVGGQCEPARLKGLHKDGLWGEIVSTPSMVCCSPAGGDG